MATSTTEPAAIEQLFDQTTAITNLDDFPQAVMTLDNLSCIEISGPDSEGFLQGQFTNDVSTLQPDSYQLNAYCNPKGRALAVFRLLKADDRYNLILPSDLAPGIIHRLQMYKMRAKVEIAEAEEVTLIGAINLDLRNRNSSCRVLSVDENRTMIVADHASANEILNNHTTQFAESDLWRIAEIVSGTPQVYSATSEEFIPQHINLDLISAVSFSKGCYPGQEIVARLRYLGKMKQRMIAGTVQDDRVIEPGQGVYTVERAEQKSGSVVEAVHCGSVYYVLSTVPSSYIDEGELRLRESSGPVLNRLPLPYPITLGKS
ncbi:MAG: hypothetical protein P8Y12_05485 [Gammaproteobacteria bacterium]